MDQIVSASFAERRLTTRLLGIFAAMAVALAAVGIYGVMSYSVAQRTRELGVRMALGAEGRDLLAMILRQGMKQALLGVAIGVVAALALTRLMAGLLFAVTPTDPVTFTLIALSLLCVAFVACIMPARRATKVDPLQALRHD